MSRSLVDVYRRTVGEPKPHAGSRNDWFWSGRFYRGLPRGDNRGW